MRNPSHILPTLRNLLCAALITLPLTANALRLLPTEVTCPLDGSTFKFSRMLSGTSFGMHLDMKPFGMTLAPVPLAKCPSNGFVIYKEKFTADEIARLKTYVASAEYQALRQTHKDYYLAAKLQRLLNEDSRVIANTLLNATWEAWSGEQYTLYATEALEAFTQLLREPKLERKQWLTYQLLAGELERRLEKFDQAHARFTALAEHEALTEVWHRDVVSLQLKLIAEKNAGSHRVPEKAR